MFLRSLLKDCEKHNSLHKQADVSDLSERDAFLKELTRRAYNDLMNAEAEGSAANSQVCEFTRLVGSK